MLDVGRIELLMYWRIQRLGRDLSLSGNDLKECHRQAQVDQRVRQPRLKGE